jgi:hypothetical protein
MSPEDVGAHQTQPLPHPTPAQTHAFLPEHDEEYRNHYFANLKTRNTNNLKKYQAVTTPNVGSTGSVQGNNKEVTQPVTETFPGSDPDTPKNWNNNGCPTAEGLTSHLACKVKALWAHVALLLK